MGGTYVIVNQAVQEGCDRHMRARFNLVDWIIAVGSPLVALSLLREMLCGAIFPT